MADWKDILSDEEEQLTDEDLLKYLDNEMSEEEKYLFEKKINSSFESDALDGLQQIKDRKKLTSHVRQLQKKLPKILLSKKQRSAKKEVKDLQWIVLTVIFLLFICIITYVIIRMNI